MTFPCTFGSLDVWGIGVEVRYRGQTIIKGSKCTRAVLWMVPLSSPKYTTTSSRSNQQSTNKCNSSNELYAGNLHKTSSQAELAMYHHQSLGSPPKTTLLQAIKRHPNLYSTFPGLNYEVISKHLPPSEATEKGHMIQRRQGINSTRKHKQVISKHNVFTIITPCVEKLIKIVKVFSLNKTNNHLNVT